MNTFKITVLNKKTGFQRTFFPRSNHNRVGREANKTLGQMVKRELGLS